MWADRIIAAAATCVLLAAPRAHAAVTEPTQAFSVQDLVRLQRLSEVAASPDGKHVAYTLRTTDMDANKGRTGIWVQDAHKRAAVPIRVSDPSANASAAEWSADGAFVYFLSNKSGSMQVWRAPASAVAATEAIQVTNTPLEVGTFHVAPKGDHIVVSIEVFPECADLACSKQKLDAAAHSPGHGVLYDKLFVRHWDTWADGRRSQLFSIALDAAGLANGTPVNVSGNLDGDVPGKPFGGREDFAISPDGSQVAFSIRIAGTTEPWSTNFDIYLTPMSGGPARVLTADNLAWDAAPAFSPNGAQLAYLAMDRPGFEADRFHLVLLDLKDGTQRPITQNWDRSLSAFQWAPDGKTLFATADHLGQHPLWSIDAASGHVSAITGAGAVESFSVAPKQVYFALNNLANPSDLYAVGYEGGATVRLSRVNQALMAQRKLGEYEQFSFAGANNDTVYGYVVKPAGFKRDHKYPIAFLVHGGPQGSMANDWHYRWNPQNFAGAGYGVVFIDFHGSTGYGQAFTDAISGDWGGKPLEDLQRGMAAALKQFTWLDGEHACALGGSYGGYMMNWIAGAWPDGFKCLVTHDGILDNRAMYYGTEELWFPEWEHGGPEYQNPEGYAKFNPVDLVKNWKTPTLVVHGQLDFRVPVEEGLAVFTALQRRGVPSELLYFPDENHWVLKPNNSIQWYDTAIAWMNRWTRP